MKKIVLPNKWRRILARLIDMAILIGTTLILYFTAVMPSVFNDDAVRANAEVVNKLYADCELFITDDKGGSVAKTRAGNIKKLEDLYKCDMEYNGKIYKNVSCTKALFDFYTTQFKTYGGEFLFSPENFDAQILQVGSKISNIKSFDKTTYRFELIDEKEQWTTYSYFKDTYTQACNYAINKSDIKVLTNKNQQYALDALLYVLPCLFGFSLIFDLIIPLCSPHGQSIGKWMTKLVVLDKDGYYLKRYYLIPRWICYICIEFVGGILTFGGMLLISYTMFLFNKKSRSMHDFFGKSVVVDGSRSLFFQDRKEEEYFKKKLNEKSSLDILN